MANPSDNITIYQAFSGITGDTVSSQGGYYSNITVYNTSGFGVTIYDNSTCINCYTDGGEKKGSVPNGFNINTNSTCITPVIQKYILTILSWFQNVGGLHGIQTPLDSLSHW